MAYDSNIILAGQAPDIIGSLSRGNQAAAQTNALRTSNDLSALYKAQGAGILAGEQGALNALAGIDPNAALNVQGARQGMDATRQGMDLQQEEMQMRRDEVRRQAEAAAATMTAAERAAEAQKIETGIKAASTAATPEQWDAIVTQFGVPDLAGQFEMKDALLTSYADVADILKGQKPPEASLVTEGAPSGMMWIDPNDRTKGVKPLPGAPAKEGMTVFGPDGQPIVQMGGGGKPLTEAQGKYVLWQNEMDQAGQTINALEKTYDPTNIGDAMASGVLGDKWGSFLTSPDGQIYKSAMLQWIDAGLRIATGAAAQEREVQRRLIAYMPQPGDDERTIQYKKEARANFQRSIDEVLSGIRPPKAPEPGAGDPGQPAPADATQMSDEDLLRKYGG